MKPEKNGLRLLFIHQNFPSQYINIARHYAADPGNTVIAIGKTTNLRRQVYLKNIRLMGYEVHDKSSENTHAYVRSYEDAVRRGQAVVVLLDHLKTEGFVPDIIFVHSFWGEGLFIDLVFPEVPVLAYAEYYGHINDPCLDFEPGRLSAADMRCRIKASNANNAVTLASVTHIQTPTRFQLGLLPECFRNNTSILYDGADTDYFSPDTHATLTLRPTEEAFSETNAPLPSYYPRQKDSLTLSRDDKVVSFINRTLEPWRGWHIFARALPLIQERHPDAHIVIVGRTVDGYGPRPPSGKNWRDIFLGEVHKKINMERVHFTGNIPLENIQQLFRISRSHIYLTYPYVLSYSPVEAMSCETPVILSDVEPAREVAEHEKTALFVDFHSPEQVAQAVDRLLGDEAFARNIGKAARNHVLENYDMARICIPKWKSVIEALIRGDTPVPLR